MQMRNEDDADGVAGAIEAPDVGDAAAAKKKAEAILARDRATVNEIAWAWVTLRDLEAGNGIASGEARYRKILFAQEEIEKLDLLKTDEAGFPVRKYNGVPVSGMNDRASVQGLVSVHSVRDAFSAGGVSWPGVAGLPSPAQPIPMGNVTGGNRSPREYLFEKAISNLKARGINVEFASLWEELRSMTRNKEAGEFFKETKSELFYEDDNYETRTYKRDSFGKWWRNNKSKYGL
ncbi:hypothetical protein [Paraburkholderia hospita]|uniref:hypothetical protein n=1 Tax=Paraburkholderia hospita TaxID=169430 RepID=UPI000B346C1C|nr:hypothetical protein [Paraburkholderia hospita]OUL68685.1 hypothetical protein CA603_51500 [Paraburkholderia hospita]